MIVRVPGVLLAVSMLAACGLDGNNEGEGEGEGVGPTCKLTVLTPTPHAVWSRVALSAGGSTGTTLEATITDFTWTLIDAPDNTAEFNGIGGSATLKSATAGTFVVGLTVTDDTGATSSLCQTSVTFE